MKPYVRVCQPELDIPYIAAHMRHDDVQEVMAMSGRTPLESLEWSYSESEIVCTVVGNHPCAMFGVSTLTDMEATVWLLGTPEIFEKHVVREFIKQSRFWFDKLNEVRPVLFNYVDERNTQHIRWLKWCGCVFLARHERYGYEQKPFLEFVRILNPTVKEINHV